MRVSGGELRSRRITVPRTLAIRPTPGRVREALFSIVGERIVGARVLDLYAGTGAIGFEALSRGAAHATFVEVQARTAARIRTAAADFGLSERTSVMATTAERAARLVEGPFDFVYADPPYAAEAPSAVFLALRRSGAIRNDTVVVYEHRPTATVAVTGFRSARVARYGDVALDFLEADA